MAYHPSLLIFWSYLGDGEERLGDLDDLGHLLDVGHADLDGLGVVGAGSVEDVLNLVGLSIGPLGIHGATELDESTPDGE